LDWLNMAGHPILDDLLRAWNENRRTIRELADSEKLALKVQMLLTPQKGHRHCDHAKEAYGLLTEGEVPDNDN
ncbi:MAG: hypothetical protein AAB590_00515, partial [Patescibacteria group bacterium]